MSRSKALINNTLVFAISNFASKFLGFLMLPLYTSVLTREEFGTADLINTTVGLLIPVFTLSMANAALRFALDKSVNSKHVFSLGLKILFLGFFILLLLFPLLYQFEIFQGYYILFYLLYLSSILQTFFSLFSRGIDKVKLVGIAGVANSVMMVVANIVLLYFLKMGVDGFLSSMVMANFLAAAILFFGGKMYQYISFKKNEKLLLKEMIAYAAPLIPNSLSWWINHTSNRYIIKYFCSVAEVGLFSAAARMPSILVAVQRIFVQAWQISAITEYDKDDNIPFFSKVYSYYNTFMVLSSSVLILATKYIAMILFAKSFYEAWVFTPFLLVSVVFGSMVGFYSSFYLAHKKTKVLFTSTLMGAIVTIGVNLILVPRIGPMGSSIANALAYFSVWLFLHVDSKKFLKLEVPFLKTYLLYVILLGQATVTVYITGLNGEIGSLIGLLVILILSRKDIIQILNKSKNFIALKRKHTKTII